VVRKLITETEHEVVNFDKLTYASTEGSVADVATNDRYQFVQGDICDQAAVEEALVDVDVVMHLAAESHVDRSIDGPSDFINTNVVGTCSMLEASRSAGVKRFHQVSTDEVFGSLTIDEPGFSESTPYDPRSPYSASKAAADHLVRAWGETYDLDVVITNCSNNYGPFHFPEKLIPLMIIRALHGERLPVYGSGENVRDWLHVEDHAAALIEVALHGQSSHTYTVGGNSERTNLEVVETVCDLVDELAAPLTGGSARRDLIEFVTDRPGHDLRYAIDDSKIRNELDWSPTYTFEEGLSATVQWYLDNKSWWQPLVAAQATERKGLG